MSTLRRSARIQINTAAANAAASSMEISSSEDELSPKSILKKQRSGHSRKVTFYPEVQVYLFTTGTGEKTRPPVFCRCVPEENVVRITCSSCNLWHTARCLNIPSNQKQTTDAKHACVRCRKNELLMKIFTKIKIGQQLRLEELTMVSNKLRIHPSGSAADIVVRLVCFLLSGPSDKWSQPAQSFGRDAQLRQIASISSVDIKRSLAVAQLDIGGRARDRVLRLHAFLSANLVDDEAENNNNLANNSPIALRRPVAPATPRPQRTARKPAPRKAWLEAGSGDENASPVHHNIKASTSRPQHQNKTTTNNVLKPTNNNKHKTKSNYNNHNNSTTTSPTHKQLHTSLSHEEKLQNLANTFLGNLTVFSKDELRTECMNCGLTRGGNKSELAQRLAMYLAEQEVHLNARSKNGSSHVVQTTATVHDQTTTV